MVRFIVWISALCGMGHCSRLLGQSFIEYADQRNDIVRYWDARPVGDGSAFVLAGYNDENGTNAGYMTHRIGVNGEFIWSTSSIYWRDLEVVQGGVAYTLERPNCEGGSTTYFKARGVAGALLFVRQFDYNPSVGYIVLHHIADRATNRLALFGPTWLMTTSLSGDSLASTQLPATNFTLGSWLSTGDLLLVGGNTLLLLDNQTNIVGSTTTDGAALDLRVINGLNHLLFADRIDTYDNELQLMASLAWDPSLGVPRRFLHTQDSCMVHTSTGVVMLSEEFDVLDTVPLSTLPDQLVNAVWQIPGGFMTAGTVSFGEAPLGLDYLPKRSSGLIRSYDLDGNTTTQGPNVALEVLTLEPVISPGATMFSHVNATVRITNNGTDTVQQLFVTHQPDPWPWTCGIIASSYTLIDLGLAPTESVERQLDGIFLLYNSQPIGGPYDAEVCMWAMSPNALVDRDISDNYACASLNSVITAVSGSAMGSTFTAYPNPTTDKIFLMGLPAKQNGTYELFDALGAAHPVKVTQGSGGSVEVDLTHLAAGTYRVVYRDEQGPRWATVSVVR